MRIITLLFVAVLTFVVSELAPGQKNIFCNTEYEIERQIGAGNNGQVFRAKALDGTLVAIKQIQFEDAESSYGVDVEIKILVLLKGGPNVLQLICAVKESKIAFIVTEYCAGGDLASHLKKNGRSIVYKEGRIRTWLVQLVTGLKYLKHKNVLHGDFKAKNILVCVLREGTPVLKIADFGNSDILPPGEGVKGIRGTALIVAPEVFRNELYDQTADLWAL